MNDVDEKTAKIIQNDYFATELRLKNDDREKKQKSTRNNCKCE